MKKSKKSAFLPTKLGFAFLFVLSFAILFFVNLGQITDLFFTDQEVMLYNQAVDQIQDSTLDRASIINSSVSTYLFWLGFGFIILLGIDLLRWVIYLYRRDVPQIDLVNQNQASYKKSLRDMWIKTGVRSLSLVGIVGWIFILLGYLLPFCSDLFIEGFEEIISVYKTLISCVIFAAYLYLLKILVGFFMLRRQMF